MKLMNCCVITDEKPSTVLFYHLIQLSAAKRSFNPKAKKKKSSSKTNSYFNFCTISHSHKNAREVWQVRFDLS